MKVEDLKIKGTWREVSDACRTTVGMAPGSGEPSSAWKRRILLAEHSPIRKIVISWRWVDLPYWVSVHFVRHKVGIEHFIRTQRSDRTGVDRSSIPQSAPVVHECEATAQAVISISRKRLCSQASPETGEAWRTMLNALRRREPELARACVPECVYRGFCPELKSCGWTETDGFEGVVEHYREW